MRVWILLGWLAATAGAHEPITTKLTWSEHISRIVFQRCAGCHRDGGTAPMALLSYEQVRPWAVAIKEEVLARRMPPWNPVKGFADYRDEQALTQEEINRIADWVEGGAPEGDQKYLPQPPGTAREPARVADSRRLTVTAVLRLAGPVTVTGIQARAQEGAGFRVVARRPDGSAEPLLWVRQYRRRWSRAYYFRNPVVLPAGSTIAVEPAGARVELLAAR